MSGRDSCLGFPLRVGLENEFTNSFLRGGIGDWSEQREAAAFPVDRVLSRGKRDISAAASAALPHAEADQFQTFQHAFGDVQLSVMVTIMVSSGSWRLAGYGEGNQVATVSREGRRWKC